jgi:capsular exopolysaccharide synthesis family protein
MPANSARAPRPTEIAALGAVEPVVHKAKPDEALVSLHAPGTFAADQYEALRHLVEREAETSGLRVLALTSATPGDGKTLTSINLAAALARGAGVRVLLVDGDLRRPSVLSQLAVDPSSCPKGLAHFVNDTSMPIERVVRHCAEHRLYLAATGQTASAPYDILGSPAMGRFFAQARRHFHFVVVDSPPAVGFPDYRQLEKWVDGTLLVVGEGTTPRKMLELALEIVDPKKARGIVLNRADVQAISRYYKGYYHKDPSPAPPD